MLCVPGAQQRTNSLAAKLSALIFIKVLAGCGGGHGSESLSNSIFLLWYTVDIILEDISN